MNHFMIKADNELVCRVTKVDPTGNGDYYVTLEVYDIYEV